MMEKVAAVKCMCLGLGEQKSQSCCLLPTDMGHGLLLLALVRIN